MGYRTDGFDLVHFANWANGYWGDRISPENAIAGTWWKNDFRVPSSFLFEGVDVNNGEASCNTVLSTALTLWGYTDGLELLCATGQHRANGTTCDSGSGDFGNISPYWERYNTAIKDKVYGGETPTLYQTFPDGTTGWPGRYLLYYHAFVIGCSAKETSASSGGDFFYKDVKTVDDDGDISTDNYEGVNKGDRRKVYVDRDDLNIIELTCQEIADRVSEYSEAFASHVFANPGEVVTPPFNSAICADANDPTNPACHQDTTSCVIDGVGWIVCSVANFIASVTDGIYSLIEQMVKVPVINTDTSSGTNGVYNTWSIMRTFANVLFVIGFLIIIFSQLTGLGVSNYGVKKTLPRLVIAAILVNVSFWLSAIAVDLSNIVGAGLYDILSGVKNDMNIGISDGGNWANILAALLGGSAIAINGGIVVGVAGVALSTIPGIGMALLFIALPLVLAALLSVLIVVFVLIARQALVILLIIVSPLAFVALLLPNTEKLFTKWRQTLTSLLLMYPIVSLIFGGAQIAGLSIMSTAANFGDQISPANAVNVGLAILTGQLVMIIPFFFIPTILTKFSGGNLDSIAGNIRNKGKALIGGIGGASRKYGMKRLGRGWESLKYRRQSGRPTPGLRGSIRSAMGGYGRKYDELKASEASTDEYLKDQKGASIRSRLGTDAAYATKSAGGDYQAGQQVASRAVAAAEAEELKKALQPLMRELASMDPSAKTAHLNAEVAAGGARAAAALHYAASIGDSGFIETHVQSANTETARMAREAVNANASALIGKAPDLVKGSDAAFSAVKAEDLAGMSKDTAKRYMKWLESQRVANPTQFASAVSSFGNALEGIKLNPTLQAKFSDETGRALIKNATSDIAVAAPTMSSIDSSGKIR